MIMWSEDLNKVFQKQNTASERHRHKHGTFVQLGDIRHDRVETVEHEVTRDKDQQMGQNSQPGKPRTEY